MYGFTISVLAFSEEWRREVGSGKKFSAYWCRCKGNSGVAVSLEIPKVYRLSELWLCEWWSVPTATIQNRDGNFVQANERHLLKVCHRSFLTINSVVPILTLQANSYPIVSLTWVLLHPEHEKNDTMKEVFGYMLSDEFRVFLTLWVVSSSRIDS